jgi:hypothetical protein
MIGYNLLPSVQVTASGYDTMTGLGSPEGPRFIAALPQAGLDP